MSDRLEYPFGPTPSWVIDRARTAKLSLEDFLLIAYLYDRARYPRLMRREPTPRMTLKQLLDALPLDVSADALSKRLRRLKERGYLDWKVERLPGRPKNGRDVYVFTLRPDGPFGVPKPWPSSSRDVSGSPRPSSERPERRAANGVADPEPTEVAEFESALPGELPAELPPDLAEFPADATPLPERDSDASDVEVWPSSSDVQSRANPSRTGTGDVGLGVDPARERDAGERLDDRLAETNRFLALLGVGGGEPCVSVDADGKLAEADLARELVIALAAVPVDETPLCRYPAHRATGDWRGRNGRVHCRVCHPPAPSAERESL